MVITDSNAKVSYTTLPTIRGNSLQINQLLQNLVGNAIKFQSSKSPEIEIAANEFTDHWLFSVSDNGIGIDQKHQEQIFNIFNGYTRQEYEVTGIELSICKKNCKRHGKTIWVESEPGQGATFYFTISQN
ncbi:MAG: ATP-binding protein [Methanobacterium sp. ERen5]|nr:MAG: ATP-binding protein [Methanobacterium sp. ERen5]